MLLQTFGINHKSAPINIREQFAFSTTGAVSALKELIDNTPAHEAVILSTCNRTEIYTISDQHQQILNWIAQRCQLQAEDIISHCYHHQDVKAVKHMMRVASGLDSMMIGEPQVLGQMKDAYRLACEAGSVGEQLQQLFPAVFSTSKHVRHSTNIGKCPVSIAYAVVKLCQNTFDHMSSARVLLVGAGTTIELAANYLHDCNVKAITIANRDVSRAEKLAEKFDASAISIGDISKHLSNIDIIISATASPQPILTKSLFTQHQERSEKQPLLIADLAVPRDVESSIADIPNVHLHNIDNLREVINDNMHNRHNAAIQAEEMIDIYAANYMRELRINEASDIIRDYRKAIAGQRDVELEKAMTSLKAGKDPEAVLKNFARNFTNKVMHKPTLTLREAASEGQLSLLKFAKSLFK